MIYFIYPALTMRYTYVVSLEAAYSLLLFYFAVVSLIQLLETSFTICNTRIVFQVTRLPHRSSPPVKQVGPFPSYDSRLYQ